MSEVLRRRRVHYFSGFDPRGAAFYHRLFREQAEKLQPDGARLEVGQRQRLTAVGHSWDVKWTGQGGDQVATQHIFMGWDDLIRQHWKKSPLGHVAAFLRVYGAKRARVLLPKCFTIHRPAFYAGLVPLVFAMGVLGLAAAAGAVGAATLGAAAGVAASLVVGLLGFLLAGSVGVLWLLRIFDFCSRMARSEVPGLEVRQALWAQQIIQMQRHDPVDEVVLVGHSVGSIVVQRTAELVCADEVWAKTEARLNLVTLGQCIPLVAAVPEAQGLRDLLVRNGANPALRWIDVSAKIDPLCFHGMYPSAHGQQERAQHGGARSLHCISAKFFQMYGPQAWRRIRRDKLGVHYLYLNAPEKTGNFNFYSWLYGASPLASRVKETNS